MKIIIAVLTVSSAQPAGISIADNEERGVSWNRITLGLEKLCSSQFSHPVLIWLPSVAQHSSAVIGIEEAKWIRDEPIECCLRAHAIETLQ